MDKLLSYHDVLLRTGDLDLLEDGHWLNDQVIAFVFEWLSREAYPTLEGLVLVNGATAFLLMHASEEEARAIAESLKLPQCRLALFAVNDNPYIDEAGGGSHWSLLAYSAHDATFHHFDSAAGSNRQPARQLSLKVNAALRNEKLQLEEAACPQQRNGYDCGMYVLAIAQLLCGRLEQQGPDMNFAVSGKEVSQGDVTRLRQTFHDLISAKAAAAAVQTSGA